MSSRSAARRGAAVVRTDDWDYEVTSPSRLLFYEQITVNYPRFSSRSFEFEIELYINCVLDVKGTQLDEEQEDFHPDDPNAYEDAVEEDFEDEGIAEDEDFANNGGEAEDYDDDEVTISATPTATTTAAEHGRRVRMGVRKYSPSDPYDHVCLFSFVLYIHTYMYSYCLEMHIQSTQTQSNTKLKTNCTW